MLTHDRFEDILCEDGGWRVVVGEEDEFISLDGDPFKPEAVFTQKSAGLADRGFSEKVLECLRR